MQFRPMRNKQCPDMPASCETTVSASDDDLNRSYTNNIQQRAILCKMFKKTVCAETGNGSSVISDSSSLGKMDGKLHLFCVH